MGGVVKGKGKKERRDMMCPGACRLLGNWSPAAAYSTEMMR